MTKAAAISTAALWKKVIDVNEILKVVLVGIFTTIVAAINKAGES